jgi:hypothetical protein
MPIFGFKLPFESEEPAEHNVVVDPDTGFPKLVDKKGTVIKEFQKPFPRQKAQEGEYIQIIETRTDGTKVPIHVKAANIQPSLSQPIEPRDHNYDKIVID